MIVGENGRAFVAVFFAAAGLDAWPVLVNARLSAREIDGIRAHCGARRVIYTTSVSPHAFDHAKRHRALIEEVAHVGAVGVSPLEDRVHPEPIDPDPSNRVAAVIYTSGTTALPKGVMLTHRNLLFIAAVSAKIRSLTPQDRLYGVLPMSHAVGLSVVLLGSLLSGATLYLCPRFDPMAARVALEKDRLTVVLGVPSMFAQFLQYAKFRGLDSLKLPALRIISSSGAPLDSATKRATEDFFGLSLHNGYGITECSPTIAQTRVETPRSDVSVGRLLPGVEAKFMGADGEEVATGEVGELRVRGPNIMKGYYRDPDATAAAIDREGWFNTGDLAKLDDGHLFIVGRTKDLIVRSGFNVYPAEVEAVLNAHPAVFRSAVIGQSVGSDEQVLAFVEVVPGQSVLVRDLEDYAAKNLAPYKRPSRIWIVLGMPVTPTGKVAKAELAKMVMRETQAVMN
jgi:acyl-CoA synthetase (AMP-forming)/AMP-acid ligase II